jgi:hypothetical protein
MLSIAGFRLGAEICEAIGLDPATVRTIELTIEPASPAKLRITRLVMDGEVETLRRVFEHYRLMSADDEADMQAYFRDRRAAR